MNERIRELLEQANMGYLFNKDEMLPGMVNPDSLKKFAQLIVRECIDVVDVGGEFVSRPKMVERLKEHFGVEE